MIRIHGHSSKYTAYECLHEPTYSSVFNITNNYGCGGYCGGSPVKIGGFWDSFAYGLGNSLSGMFGGLGGMFGGGMGMFPMFNMFGMCNMFGGGMGMFPWFNMFGGGASSSKTTTASTVASTCGCSGKGTGKVDLDDAKVNEFDKEISDTTNPITKDRAKALYKEISELAKKPIDTEQEVQNKDAYLGLLRKLEDKYPELKTEEGAGEAVGNDGEDDISKAFPDLNEDMKSKLQKIGVKPVQIDDKWYISLPKDLNVENVKILAESGLPVAMGYNSNSACKDHWIAGKITLANDFSETNFKWEINCVGYGKYGNTYSVERPNNDNPNDFKISVTNKAKPTGKKLKNGADYKFSTHNNAPTLIRDGIPVYTEQEDANDTYYEI